MEANLRKNELMEQEYTILKFVGSNLGAGNVLYFLFNPTDACCVLFQFDHNQKPLLQEAVAPDLQNCIKKKNA